MGPAEALVALIAVGLPILVLGYLFHRWFKLKEKKLDVEASLAVEKAAQYAASNAQLEARLRVLEQIVTDAGAQTANQIEALRDTRASEWRRSPMNPFEMVVLIVAIVMIASVFKARHGSRRRGRETGEPVDSAETMRLREEVKMLKERLHVLERITTEKESSLSREIEELRDR
jgi:hypothetical protein